MKEAMFYKREENNIVRCCLCSIRCKIPINRKGYCNVRKNVNGKLYSLNYGIINGFAPDPIEKKPFFHFAPASIAMSFSCPGCNLKCSFCQNWQISQEHNLEGYKIEPENIVELALNNKCDGIAYTYTEPTVFFEYAYEVMKIAKKNKLYNVWVSNGYMSKEVIKKSYKLIDAINIDLKGDNNFYKKVCKAPKGIEPVLISIKMFKNLDVWVEVTNLIIPENNDNKEWFNFLVNFILSIDKSIPIHFSRFHPDYKMIDAKITSEDTLNRAVEIAKKNGLKYVYVGNVPGSIYENTICWKCGNVVIKRFGFSIEKFSETCECGTKIKIVGKKWSPFFK